jgi:methylmalonyl-CoA epimerase
MSPSIGLLRIDHVGVAVADLDAAIEFYTRVFGMTCVHVEENAEQEIREAMMSVGPDPSGGCVQLLAPLSESSTITKFLNRNGPGVQQVAYTVADVDEAAAESAGPRDATPVRGGQTRHSRFPRELRPSEGRRWCTGRAGRTGAALSRRAHVRARARAFFHMLA